MLHVLVLLAAVPAEPVYDYPCPMTAYLKTRGKESRDAMQVIDCIPVWPITKAGEELDCTQTLVRVDGPRNEPVPSVDQAKALLRAEFAKADAGTGRQLSETEVSTYASMFHTNAEAAAQTCRVQVGLPQKLRVRRVRDTRTWVSTTTTNGGMFCRTRQTVKLEPVSTENHYLWRATFSSETVASEKGTGCKALDSVEVYEGELEHKTPTEGCSVLKLGL